MRLPDRRRTELIPEETNRQYVQTLQDSLLPDVLKLLDDFRYARTAPSPVTWAGKHHIMKRKHAGYYGNIVIMEQLFMDPLYTYIDVF